VLRLMVRSGCLVAVLLLAGLALAQSEFSADIVDTSTQKAGRGPTKVYFGQDKMRFDTANNDPSGGGGVIFDLKNESWLVLMAKQHMYMEMPSKMMENRGMFHFFKSGDVDNACPEWEAMAANKGGSCHKIGHETVNGRDTVKYEGINSEGEKSTVWLDSKVRFPIKWEGKNNGGELQNIKEGSQPSSLFEIPSDYKKFDMGAMGNMGGMQRPK
jgi:hypothetical protein